MRTPMSALVLIAGLLAAGAAARADEVPLKTVVPEYLDGDLETAIIPTPKQAELRDVAVELKAVPVCVAPAALVAAAQVLDETNLHEQLRAAQDWCGLGGAASAQPRLRRPQHALLALPLVIRGGQYRAVGV